MSDPPSPLTHSEREARRALLHEALVDLASTGDRAFVTRDRTNASCGRPESSFVAQPTRAAATERYAAARSSATADRLRLVSHHGPSGEPRSRA